MTDCDHHWLPGGDWGPKHGHPWSSQDRYCVLCGLEGCEALNGTAPFITTGNQPTYVSERNHRLARRKPITNTP